LDALFRNEESTLGRPQSQNDVSIVSLEALVPSPRQPRKNFAPDTLEELAASIRSQGIVQPLLVRPTDDGAQYEIVAGERRWRAARLAGLMEIPVLVRPLSDMEVMAAALIENLQREDLNPLEEARALAALRTEFGLSQDELANTLGKSRPAIANALRLLNLNAEAQDALEKGHISAGHARAILSLGNLDLQSEFVQHCIQDALSVRDAEYAAILWKEEGHFPWAKVGKDDHAAVQAQEQPANDAQAAVPELRQALLRKTQSLFLQQAQKQLRQDLKIRASISGTEARGRISLSYQSQEELHVLLRRLGIDSPDSA
jgi:ParB family chromosome partitioning protein